MPIYEYRCQDCEHQFDALQKMSDAVLTDCPSCKKAALIKLISAPAFRLSGSGWYETDFKTDKDKKKNLTGGDSKGANTAADTKKTTDKKASSESKPKSDSAKKTSSGNSTSANA